MSLPTEDPFTQLLAEAHDEISHRHQHAREELLNHVDQVVSGSPANQPAPVENGRVVRSMIWGSFGAVSCGLIAMIFWLSLPLSASVAMDRLVLALDTVESYSFRMEAVFTEGGDSDRSVRTVQTGALQTSPPGLRARVTLIETAQGKAPQTIVDIEDIHPPGGQGIILDHLDQSYWPAVEQITGSDIPAGSTQALIYKVRQQRGRVVEDLGLRQREGRQLRGLVFTLDKEPPATELGPTGKVEAADWDWRGVPVEVWIDTKTNLPVEFRCTRRRGTSVTHYRCTDLVFHPPVDVDTFQTQPPADYQFRQQAPWATEEATNQP